MYVLTLRGGWFGGGGRRHAGSALHDPRRYTTPTPAQKPLVTTWIYHNLLADQPCAQDIFQCISVRKRSVCSLTFKIRPPILTTYVLSLIPIQSSTVKLKREQYINTLLMTKYTINCYLADLRVLTVLQQFGKKLWVKLIQYSIYSVLQENKYP